MIEIGPELAKVIATSMIALVFIVPTSLFFMETF